jgi:kynurenine formamidase
LKIAHGQHAGRELVRAPAPCAPAAGSTHVRLSSAASGKQLHATQEVSMSRFVAVAALGLAAVSLGAGESPAQSLDLSAYSIIDLTHPFNSGTPYWPTSPSGFELKRLSFGPTEAGFFYAANAFCAPEHGGTHLDAPIHFSQRGSTADKIPIRQLVAPAVVIDVSGRAADDHDYRLTRDDVLAFENEHGRIAPGTIVLVRTGWSLFYDDRKRYFGDDKPGDASNLHFPSYGEDAARILVEDRKVAAIGVDTPSIDYGPSKDFPVHRLAAAADVPGLENLARLREIPAVSATVIALPMLIEGGSGAPLRAIALVPRAGC